MIPFGFFETHKASTWNPSDKDASFTLSNNNLTITGGGAGGSSFVSARATPFLRPAEKYYVEFVLLGNPGGLGVGFLDTGVSLASFAGSNTSGLSAFTGNRSWSYGGGGVAICMPSTPVVNDVLCLALDGVNQVAYCRINGGNWNNSGTANPATNTGGFSCPGLFALKYAICFVSNNVTASATLNAGSSAFSFTPPLGFHSPNSTAQS